MKSWARRRLIVRSGRSGGGLGGGMEDVVDRQEARLDWATDGLVE